jgi:hypothetical protein
LDIIVQLVALLLLRVQRVLITVKLLKAQRMTVWFVLLDIIVSKGLTLKLLVQLAMFVLQALKPLQSLPVWPVPIALLVGRPSAKPTVVLVPRVFIVPRLPILLKLAIQDITVLSGLLLTLGMNVLREPIIILRANLILAFA